MEIIGDPEALKQEILEAARREGEAVAAAAAGEAAGLLAAAEAEAAAARRALLDAARSEGAHRRAMLLASVPAEAAKLRAARLERLLDAVRAEASALLAAGAAGPAGKSALAALAAEAAAGIGGSSFVISSAPGSGLPALAGEIARLAGLGPLDLRFEEEPGLSGGAVVRSADGLRRWDNSFSGRMERLWPELRREIAAELGNGGFNER